MLNFATQQFHFGDSKDARISHANFVTFYSPATDLVNAARKEGVAIFDANERNRAKCFHADEIGEPAL